METQINFNLNNACWSEMWNLHSSTTFLSVCLWVLSSLTWNEWITHQHLASAGEIEGWAWDYLKAHTSSSWCWLLAEAWAGAIVQNVSIWLSMWSGLPYNMVSGLSWWTFWKCQWRLCYLLWLTLKSHTVSLPLHSIQWNRRACSGKACKDWVKGGILPYSLLENSMCYRDTLGRDDATCSHFYVLFSPPRGCLSLSAITLCVVDLIFPNKYKRDAYHCKIQGEMQKWQRLNISLQGVHFCLISCIRGRAFEQGIPSSDDITVGEIVCCLIKHTYAFLHIILFTFYLSRKCKQQTNQVPPFNPYWALQRTEWQIILTQK